MNYLRIELKNTLKLNVLGKPLECCCDDPKTGFFRDGYCQTDDHDFGRHVVCAIVSQDFLDFSLEKGNDLITPRLDSSFPGLKENDSWCLCAMRWREAYQAGCAPKIDLEATDVKALEFIPLDVLKEFSYEK
jgi:uncharacterized protein (DUF2237 family)